MQYRKLAMLLQRYLDILNKYAFFDSRFGMKRIFPTISQTTVPSGRLAFDNPNLQAITHPVMFSPVEEDDNSQPKLMTISVRDAFQAMEGCVLLSLDYSQLEVRIMTHFSNDPLLHQILKDGGDLFRQLASQWFEKPVATITEKERSLAKNICYGVINGMGLKSVSEILGVTKSEAEAFITSFKSRFSA